MEPGNENFRIAEMYFRIEIDEILHDRLVIGFMEWLGEVGGIAEIMSRALGFFLAGWLAFN